MHTYEFVIATVKDDDGAVDSKLTGWLVPTPAGKLTHCDAVKRFQPLEIPVRRAFLE